MGTAEPHQTLLSLDYAPPDVRERFVEVHSYPAVGCRTSPTRERPYGAVRCVGRRSPGDAWKYQLIELTRSGRARVALALDCDSEKAIGVVFDALRDMDALLPQPNIVIQRRASGHTLAVWTLGTPVGSGPNSRQAPLEFFGRVSEYYSFVSDADTGFTSFLCSNPVHADYATYWGHRDPYELRELGTVIPRGWQIPRFERCRSAEGRNSRLFHAGCRYAGILSRSDQDVAQYVHCLNQHHGDFEGSLIKTTPLAWGEVEGIIRSIVHHYRPIWRGRTSVLPEFSDLQRERGRKGGLRSGEVRRAKPSCLSRERPWEAEDVSRATWFRRRGLTVRLEANTGSAPSSGALDVYSIASVRPGGGAGGDAATDDRAPVRWPSRASASTPPRRLAESPSESLPDVRRGLAATASEELSELWRGRPLDLPHLRQGLAG